MFRRCSRINDRACGMEERMCSSWEIIIVSSIIIKVKEQWTRWFLWSLELSYWSFKSYWWIHYRSSASNDWLHCGWFQKRFEEDQEERTKDEYIKLAINRADLVYVE